MVGWSEVSITPEGKRIRLAGQFAERISEYVETPITVTALAIESDGDEIRVQIGSHCVTAAWNRDVRTGEDCELVVRPEAIRIGREGMLPCKVELSCFMGSYQNYHVRVGDTLVKIADNCPVNKEIFREGENAWISFDKECAHLL